MMRNVWMIVAVCFCILGPGRAGADVVDRGIALFLASDFAASAAMLETVAGEGDGRADFLIGVMQTTGLRIEQNAIEGAVSFIRSASQGFVPGAMTLVFAVDNAINDESLTSAATSQEFSELLSTQRRDIEAFVSDRLEQDGVSLKELTDETVVAAIVDRVRQTYSIEEQTGDAIAWLLHARDAGASEIGIWIALASGWFPEDVRAEQAARLVDPDQHLSVRWLYSVASASMPSILNLTLDEDIERSFAYHRAAARRGMLASQLTLARLLRSGEHTPGTILGTRRVVRFEQNLSESFLWYSAAANRGNAEAQYWVGQFHANADGLGDVVPRDWGEAVQWYTRAAEQDHAEAMRALHLSYFAGLGVPRDSERAMEWLTRAAEQNHAGSQALLAEYLYGSGRVVEARDWFLRAAENGEASAMVSAGQMVNTGQGGPSDPVAGAALFRRAAEAGNAEGQFRWGVALFVGRGVAQDQAAGNRWIRQSADAGYAEAQSVLAQHLHGGTGIARDPVAARDYARRAAVQGNLVAQVNLGAFIFNDAVSNNRAVQEALSWYLIAEANGFADAEMLRGNISRAQARLTAQQIAAARAMAERCRSSNYQNCNP